MTKSKKLKAYSPKKQSPKHSRKQSPKKQSPKHMAASFLGHVMLRYVTKKSKKLKAYCLKQSPKDSSKHIAQKSIAQSI